uniref:C-type lectin domain-containing protein n=1 Tax=Labrus bergylta TaxID=56723 RepID=A0A3Q3GKG7_9LABR
MVLYCISCKFVLLVIENMFLLFVVGRELIGTSFGMNDQYPREINERKHNFFPQKMTWFEAQAYCRENHTDLSFVSSEREQKMLQTAAGGSFVLGWIGLHKDAVNSSVWKWSGGGDSTYFNWAPNQPNYHNREQTVVILWADGKWNDKRPSLLSLPQSFCHFRATAATHHRPVTSIPAQQIPDSGSS